MTEAIKTEASHDEVPDDDNAAIRQTVEHADKVVTALRLVVPILSVGAGALTALPAGALLTSGVIVAGLAAAAASILKVHGQNKVSELRRALAQAEDSATTGSQDGGKPWRTY